MSKAQNPAATALTFDDAVIACSSAGAFPEQPRLESSPMLAALRGAGTSHVYADTASREELRQLLARDSGAIVTEIDGNTANQPLVHKVAADILDEVDVGAWLEALRVHRRDADPAKLAPELYAILCGWIGNGIARAFASRRLWEVSLQLHMRLDREPERARHVGRLLRRMVATAFVKVPFSPHAPDCFLVARDLERAGIPVNFTSTFSARQVVAAALLADVTRTNVFMGRLDQGLQAERLGEHVDLEAQRALLRLRRDAGVKTRLIVASMRDWRSFVNAAGCDVFTAPCGVIRDFMEQDEVAPEQIESRLETSYEDRLGVADEVGARVGADRIARLYRVEPELVEFLLDYRRSDEYRDLGDGAQLVRRFEDAGFGDLFYAPSEVDWKELRASKIPDLDAPLTGRLALDTLYTLLADADFERHQEEIDAQIARRLER